MSRSRGEGETIPSGDFGRGGHHRVTGFLSFRGRLGPTFARFAQTRARRLSLNGAIQSGPEHAIVRIEGPEALVGAFEMACIIGPETCSIDHWRWFPAGSSIPDSDSFSAFDDYLEF
jgi:hypothetical protein